MNPSLEISHTTCKIRLNLLFAIFKHTATDLAGIPRGLRKVHKEQAKPDSHIFDDSSPSILCIVVKLIYK